MSAMRPSSQRLAAASCRPPGQALLVIAGDESFAVLAEQEREPGQVGLERGQLVAVDSDEAAQ
jgi:hypothetical protein